MQKQRIDVLLHILTDKVKPDFRRAELRVSLNFEPPQYPKAEILGRKKANALDGSEADTPPSSHLQTQTSGMQSRLPTSQHPSAQMNKSQPYLVIVTTSSLPNRPASTCSLPHAYPPTQSAVTVPLPFRPGPGTCHFAPQRRQRLQPRREFVL